MTQAILLCPLTLAASGIVHLFGDVRKVLLFALIFSIPATFVGAYIAKRFLDRLPQKYFRISRIFFLFFGQFL